jgi:hypothetical protein
VLSGQRRRIRSNSRLTLLAFRVIIQGQLRNADFLLLDDVPLWLLTVQINRVSDDVRVRVDYIQTYLVASVQRAFGELTGLALGDQPSSAIEDLRELDRIDEAFQRLAEVSSRQDRAALVVRDILAQLREMRTACAWGFCISPQDVSLFDFRIERQNSRTDTNGEGNKP